MGPQAGALCICSCMHIAILQQLGQLQAAKHLKAWPGDAKARLRPEGLTVDTCLCSNLTLAASLSSASSLVLQPANSLTFELIMGAKLTFAGFAIHAMSPATNVPPQTSNYTHGWTWSVQGLTIHGLFGTVLPYIVEFATSLEDAPQANSSLLLKDMVINYTSCGQAWPTVAAIIAQPPGVRQSPESRCRACSSSCKCPQRAMLSPCCVWHVSEQ